MERLPVLYVFVRTDLPSMTPGKAQAHSGHAANAFIYKHFVQPTRRQVETKSIISEWMAATPQGFGTQMNLRGSWTDVVNTVAEFSERDGGIGEIIFDPTYPYIIDDEILGLIDPKIHTVEPKKLDNGNWLCHRHEATAAYLFGYKDELEPYVGRYPLHP